MGDMSNQDERQLEHDRILLALGSHKGHDGIPGAPKGVLCLRCEAERALERTLGRLEAAERLNQTWVERYIEEIRLRREAESALAEAREAIPAIIGNLEAVQRSGGLRGFPDAQLRKALTALDALAARPGKQDASS